MIESSYHDYFGKITKEDILGFFAEIRFHIPYFNEEPVFVYLGDNIGENGEEVDTPPTKAQLDEYATTLDDFLCEIGTGSLIVVIQRWAYNRYLEIYADYYEKQVKKKEKSRLPLKIKSKEEHFEYMKEINDIRVMDNKMIEISINYDFYSLYSAYPTTESLQTIFNYENNFIENRGLGIVIVDNKMFSIGDDWTYGY